MKKILTTLLTVVLTATLAIGGTLAYLTDRDSEVNTFTLGNVDIELNEDFVQGSQLLPGLDVNKDVKVKNIGTNNAYVFYTYSVPTALISTAGNASKNVIHFNPHPLYWDAYYNNQAYLDKYGVTEAVDLSDTWHYSELVVDDFELDGIKYTTAIYYYNGVVEPGEETNTALDKVYLDTRVDITPEGDMYWVENGTPTDLSWNVNEQGNPKIYVNAYAIQAEGLKDTNADEDIDVEDALTLYKEQWGSLNGTHATVVSNAEELAEALEEGGSIALGADVVGEEGTSMAIPENVTAELNLNGYNLVNAVEGAPGLVNNGTLTISNGTIANTVNNANGSAAIRNNGKLTIDGGVIGTADSSGAAVVNYGDVVINGGTFSSRQESEKGKGNAAYVFINQAGTMTINGGIVDQPTHGLFAAYGGKVVVNGGNFTLKGDLACYITYTTGDGNVLINGGTIDQQVGRNGRSFFHYDATNKKSLFNKEVIDGGYVVVSNNATVKNVAEITFN